MTVKDLSAKVAYLQGLAEGMKLSPDSNEGKLFTEILDVLEEMADAILDLEDGQDELQEYAEALDSDLADLEEDFYDDDCDCCCDCDCDDDCDCDCCCDDEGDGYVDVECPNCHEIVCFSEDILDDEDIIEVVCPNCDAVVFVNDGSYDIDFVDDDECECGCGCEDDEDK